MYSFKKYDDGTTKFEVIDGPVGGAETIIVPRTPHITVILAFFVAIILVIWYRFFVMRLAKFSGDWVFSMQGRNVAVNLKTNFTGDLIVHGPKIHLVGRPVKNGIVFSFNGDFIEAAASPSYIHSRLFQLKRIQ